MNLPTLNFRIISDIIWPWCYVAQARIAKVAKEYSNQAQISFEWEPYMLNVNTPKEGYNLIEYLVRKYGEVTLSDLQSWTANLGSRPFSRTPLAWNAEFSSQSVLPKTKDEIARLAARVRFLTKARGRENYARFLVGRAARAPISENVKFKNISQHYCWIYFSGE